MALTNYGELKTSIANWLARSDLTSAIPDFVALCEADFNSRLRVREMETTGDLTINAETVAQPAGLLAIRRLYLDTSPRYEIQVVAPFHRQQMYGASTTGRPRVVSVEGTNLTFSPAPDTSYTGKLLYYKAFDALSLDADTNYVLTNHPDVYLYGSLAHSAPYIVNDERVQLWQAAYAAGLNRIMDADKNAKFSGSPLVMRPQQVV